MRDSKVQIVKREDTEERVEEVLRGIRAGVRQRRAEWAALADGGDLATGAAVELQNRAQVQEPRCTSSQPVVGRFFVFVRKAFYHLFMKWWARPVVAQQNDFNQVAAQRITKLLETQGALRQQVESLEARLNALERGSSEGAHEAASSTSPAADDE